MASSDALGSTLNEIQLQALETFAAVTNQEPSQAIPLLQRSEWNVQVWCEIHPIISHSHLCRLLLPNSSMENLLTQSRKLAQL